MEPPVGLNINNLYQTIFDLITGKYLPGNETLPERVFSLLDTLRPYSVFISLVFLTGIIYCTIRTRTILHDYIESMHGGHGDDHGHEHVHGEGHEGEAHGDAHAHSEDSSHGHDQEHGHSDSHADSHDEHEHHGHDHGTLHPPQKPTNSRWDKIVLHINSLNQSDWRLAILECDIILDEMLTKMSYHGETLSDKLKAVEKSDFITIDKAWEAHRVRNAIAHEGTSFQINEREARRVVGLYEEVFKEFHYI